MFHTAPASQRIHRTADHYPRADKTDLGLLHNTQAYLVRRQERREAEDHLIEAWRRFYHIYDPLLRQIALTCHVSTNDVEDCVQRVWVELILKLPHFHYQPQRGRFQGWLYTLVRSKAIDLLRQRNRHPTYSLPPEALLLGREADPAESCAQKCLQIVVRRMLAELRQLVSALSYQVLHLRWIEGCTVKEVAAALGLTSRQVWLREHRLKKKLRRLLMSAAAT